MKLASIIVFGSLFVFGCSGSEGSDSGSSEGAAYANPSPTAAPSASVPAPADTPITVQNYMSHPKIAEIRKLVQATDAKITAGGVKKDEKVECDGTETTDKFTENGKVLKIYSEGGIEGIVRDSYYYDDTGKLRFEFLDSVGELGCVMVQYRRYFDANGKELISVERRADGQLKEGSDFCPGVAEKLAATKDSLLQQPPPAADLMSNPERAYATPAVCQ